jgi:predicted enzyme related to lactoylglutathione lyase
MSSEAPAIFRVFAPVSDLAKGVEFYQHLFNNEGRIIRGGRHYFDCGAVILAVVENSGIPTADHIYFAVPNLETFHTRAKELDCLEGGEVHGEPAGEMIVRPWGERSFYVRDPFGNGLCFVDEKTLPPLADRFEDYMAERHLPDMMATGCFLSATLSRSGDRFQMMYTAADRAAIDRYLAEHGELLRADNLMRFPVGVEITRQLWDVMAEFNSA